MRWLKVVGALPLIVCVVSCAPASGQQSEYAHPVVMAAVTDNRVESAALEICEKASSPGGFVAAFESTAGEVREIASAPPGGSPRDLSGLPADDAATVSVCISGGNSLFQAVWLTETETGVVAIFDDAGQLAEI
ncbi:hypothetical protein [Homoserinibacter sp. GY 40078]|uniref:hypothetical protein n=1 Tax=Homoserinibacter sp. GY 40078 TaxID=2603275 RepID=UPI0011C90DEB|nr:hypothetical protein [Homoserinibacter sp. GY 40078]TXK18758.1 hypothetical protein FVQ89_02110 [Homoserinibacter sp. GY 40078]